MNVAFFVRHFTERGTEVAIYDYAKYNEEILHNKSFIVCFTPEAQKRHRFPSERCSFEHFRCRFPMIEIHDMHEMTYLIQLHNFSFFYTLTGGGSSDIYDFHDKALWGPCKTIKHCVFETRYPEADFHISISETLNQKNRTDLLVIPHIGGLPQTEDDLREELSIPKDAVVFGRHGAPDEFNISFVHDVIRDHLERDREVYFLFLNTDVFYVHPRIVYLKRTVDPVYKAKFVNSCDAMIHARQIGETFGLSVAEFSCKNKPVITCRCGDTEHLKILGDMAVVYQNREQLADIFANIKTILASRTIWNAYKLYTPEYVMNLFQKHIFRT